MEHRAEYRAWLGRSFSQHLRRGARSGAHAVLPAAVRVGVVNGGFESELGQDGACWCRSRAARDLAMPSSYRQLARNSLGTKQLLRLHQTFERRLTWGRMLTPVITWKRIWSGARWPLIQKPGGPINSEPGVRGALQFIRTSVANENGFAWRHFEETACEQLNSSVWCEDTNLEGGHKAVEIGRQRTTRPGCRVEVTGICNHPPLQAGLPQARQHLHDFRFDRLKGPSICLSALVVEPSA